KRCTRPVYLPGKRAAQRAWLKLNGYAWQLLKCWSGRLRPAERPFRTTLADRACAGIFKGSFKSMGALRCRASAAALPLLSFVLPAVPRTIVQRVSGLPPRRARGETGARCLGTNERVTV